MNNSTLVFLINDDVRALSVAYEPDGTQMIVKTMDPDIKVGDMVVVESTTRHKITTAKVEAVDIEPDLETSIHMHWVVGVIRLDDHKEILQKEIEAIATVQRAEKRKKRDALREALFNDSDANVKALALSSDSAVTE